jgi:hypothetical protein
VTFLTVEGQGMHIGPTMINFESKISEESSAMLILAFDNRAISWYGNVAYVHRTSRTSEKAKLNYTCQTSVANLCDRQRST